MMPKYQAAIYPDATTNPTVTQADPDRKDIAVCFSGGGSRALSCAWGQMIGLRTVLGENNTPLLDQVRYISFVSGGAWASALYSFYPETISDDDFLGASYPPSNLYYDQDQPNGLNVSKMAASALGKVPQNFANLTNLDLFKNVIADFVILTLLKGIPLSDSAKWQGNRIKYPTDATPKQSRDTRHATQHKAVF